MPQPTTSDGVQIDHLKVVDGTLGTLPELAIEQGIQRLLSQADLHPRNLARSEILLVRNCQVAEDLPLDPTSPGLPGSWQTNTRTHLEALAGQATKPQAGSIAGDPVAVRFADLAELLACLALALANGEANRQWWWRSWLRQGHSMNLPTALLWRDVSEQHPTAVAASLRLLLSWRRFSETAPLWHDRGVTPVLEILAKITPEVAAWLPRVVEATRPAPSNSRSGVGSPGSEASNTLPPALREDLRHCWAETTGRPGLRLLALVAGLVVDAPHQLARTELAKLVTIASLSEQSHSKESPQNAESLPSRISPPPQTPLQDFDNNANDGNLSEPGQKTTPGLENHDQAKSSKAVAARSLPPARKDSTRKRVQSAPAPSSSSKQPKLRPNQLSSKQQPSRTGNTQEKLDTGSTPRQADASPTAVGEAEDINLASLSSIDLSTGLAGIFYLVNLPQAKALPDVSRWSELEILARGLCSKAGLDQQAVDPVWRAFAWLDQRGDLSTLPIPPDKLATTAENQLDEDLAKNPLLAHLDSQWLGYLAARMELALADIDDALPDVPQEEQLQLVLDAPGQIRLTRTHVDIHLPLDAIALPLRIAGLDRNPGWLPEYGRVIQFHFD